MSEKLSENPPPYAPDPYSPQTYPPTPQPQGYPPPQPQGYPPPQPQGYPPPQPQPGYYMPQPVLMPVPVVQTQPPHVTTTVTSFDTVPVQLTCPNCNKQQITRINRKVGSKSWLICFVTVLVMCVLGIPFLVPFAFICLCIPSLKDIEHRCPNCNFTVGVKKR